MPSLEHELYVEMFRDRPQLARDLLRYCTGVDLPGRFAEAGTVDLSHVAPPEFRADWITILRDDDLAPVSAIVVEVQLQIDRRKQMTWPVYVTTLRARLECGVTLLVLAPEIAVAEWARVPIEIGHPRFRLEPLAIALSDIPRIVDLDVARVAPELAVLSAIAHPDLEVAEAAVVAIAGLSNDKRELYLDSVLAALPELARQMMESRMKGYEFKTEFVRKLARSRDETLEEGREEGREEGLHDAAVLFARTKIGTLSADDEAAIRGLHDHAALSELIVALGNAASASDAIEALARIRRSV